MRTNIFSYVSITVSLVVHVIPRGANFAFPRLLCVAFVTLLRIGAFDTFVVIEVRTWATNYTFGRKLFVRTILIYRIVNITLFQTPTKVTFQDIIFFAFITLGATHILQTIWNQILNLLTFSKCIRIKISFTFNAWKTFYIFKFDTFFSFNDNTIQCTVIRCN